MKIKKTFVSLCVMLSTLSSNAWDVDSHFYAFVAVLEWAGFMPEIARKGGAYSAWIDVGIFSTSMGDPTAGTRLRRLFHFTTVSLQKEIPEPNPQQLFEFESKILNKEGLVDKEALEKYQKIVADSAHGKDLGVLIEVIKDNPMAYEMITEGFLRGDFKLFMSGMHVYWDSFGHSGYSPLLGHSSAGHHPDRPFMYIRKYLEMLKITFKILAIAKQGFPQEALNPYLNTKLSNGTTKANVKMTPEEQYESFINIPEVRVAIAQDVRRMESYTKTSITAVLYSLYESGIIISEDRIREVLSHPDLFKRRFTSDQILKIMFQELLELPPEQRAKVIDVNKLFELHLKDIYSEASFDHFIHRHKRRAAEKIAYPIIRRFVPHDLDKSRTFIIEKGNIVRMAEMEIRISNWQAVIQKISGGKTVVFDEGEYVLSKIKAAILNKENYKFYLNKILRRDLTKKIENFEREMHRVSLNLQEQIKWSATIWAYTWVDWLRNIGLVEGWSFSWKDFTESESKWNYLRERIGWNMIEAKPGSHNVVNPLIYAFKDADKFKEYLERGIFLKILSAEQANALIEQYNAVNNLPEKSRIMPEERVVGVQTRQDRVASQRAQMCKFLFTK